MTTQLILLENSKKIYFEKTRVRYPILSYICRSAETPRTPGVPWPPGVIFLVRPSGKWYERSGIRILFCGAMVGQIDLFAYPTKKGLPNLIDNPLFSFRKNGAEGQNRTADTGIFSHICQRLRHFREFDDVAPKSIKTIN